MLLPAVCMISLPYVNSNWSPETAKVTEVNTQLSRFRSIGEVLYCFSRSSVKLQGHTRQKMADFDSNLVFPDCNSILN